MAMRPDSHPGDRRYAHRTGWVLAALLLLASPPSSSAQTQTSRYINPPGLTKPNGYTHVVVAPDNRTVYLAGQVAFDSTGQLVGAGDFKAQAQRVYENLRRALASVGGSLDDVVKTTTFITDIKNLPACAKSGPRSPAVRPPARQHAGGGLQPRPARADDRSRGHCRAESERALCAVMLTLR